jgi:hypothetical protein
MTTDNQRVASRVDAASSIPSARICFPLELVNERRSFASPFEPPLGRHAIEFGMADL